MSSDKTRQQWADTDHKSRQNPSAPPRTAVATWTVSLSENLPPSAASSTRDSDSRSILTEKDQIQGEVTCQSHLERLFCVQETLQELTARRMRKRAQQDVLHSVPTFLIRREEVTFVIRGQSFHQTWTQTSQNFWLHNSLITCGDVCSDILELHGFDSCG